MLLSYAAERMRNSALKGSITCIVQYPSNDQVASGNTPYVEYLVGDGTWRAYFTLPDEYRYDNEPQLRPKLFYVKVRERAHLLYMWVGAEVELGITSKQSVPR